MCAALLAVTLGGCSGGLSLNDFWSKKTKEDATSLDGLDPNAATPDDKAVAGVYNQGLSAMKAGNYVTANKKFADVERKYPYSKWATNAILMQAFSSYQANSYDESVTAAKRFIELHPGHKDTPYAYYLISLSQFEQIKDVKRDQSQTAKALEALEEVERRFPDSKYVRDVKRRQLMAKDTLAAKDMEVGRFYMKRGSYLAGINRFKRVVTEFQTTSHVPEALYRLAEGYMALGVVSEARTATAVLGHNFPKSSWYRDAYTLVASDGRAPVADQGSWISKAFAGVSSLNPFNG
jgi:outer membrane protein assembly factor BamD